MSSRPERPSKADKGSSKSKFLEIFKKIDFLVFVRRKYTDQCEFL